MTARQLKKHPKCKRPHCPYFKSTDTMVTENVPNGSTCGLNGGGDYCCSDCRDGTGHGVFCHKIRVKEDSSDYSDDPSLSRPTKFLMPFLARSLLLRWTESAAGAGEQQSKASEAPSLPMDLLEKHGWKEDYGALVSAAEGNRRRARAQKNAEAELKGEEPVDEALLSRLTDMGFPSSRARKALLSGCNDEEAATDWLLAHDRGPANTTEDEDPDEDENGTPSYELQILGHGAGDQASAAHPEGDWGAMLLAGVKVKGPLAARINNVPADTLPTAGNDKQSPFEAGNTLAAADVSVEPVPMSPRTPASLEGSFLVLDLPSLTTVVGIRSKALASKELILELYYSQEPSEVALAQQGSWIPYSVERLLELSTPTTPQL